MDKLIDLLVEKKFKTAVRGYNKLEVDTFLDEIIENLEEKEKENNMLIKEKEKYEKENMKLKMEIVTAKDRKGFSDTTSIDTHTMNKTSAFTENTFEKKMEKLEKEIEELRNKTN